MKKTLVAISLTALSLAPLVAQAEGGLLRVRGGLAAVSYVFPSPNGMPDQKSSFGAMTLGGSYVTEGGWFIDLATRNSLGAKWNAKEYNEAQGEFTEDADFSRDELTLTLGKSLGSGWALFGGVQASTLEQVFPATTSGGESTWKQDGSLTFLGVSKAFSMGSGALSVSGALGSLKYDFPEWAGQPDRGAGGSLGVTFTYPFTNNLGIAADARFQRYTIKWQDTDFDENINSLGVSLVGQF